MKIEIVLKKMVSSKNLVALSEVLRTLVICHSSIIHGFNVYKNISN
jgi:hypothetical protein